MGTKSRKLAAIGAPAGMLAGFLAHALLFHSHLHGEYLFLMSVLWIGVAALSGAAVLGIWRDLRRNARHLKPRTDS